MPAFLQLATVCMILSFVSNAVLAVVVTQTPLHAFASHTGVMGVVGAGLLLLLLVVVEPVVVLSVLLQASSNVVSNTKENEQKDVFI